MRILTHKTQPLGKLSAKVFRVLLRKIGGILAAVSLLFEKKPDPASPEIFMFFPYYHTGGAERVHADIISCLASYRPRVFTALVSSNTAFKSVFAQKGRLRNASFFYRHTILRFILFGFLAETINRARHAVVFGANCFHFYDMLPLLSKKVKKVDLLHAFGGGPEIYSLPYVPVLDARIVISQKTSNDFAQLYAARNIDSAYLNRIHVIENKISVPSEFSKKNPCAIKVLYVGRGSEEKRVHLVGKIAREYASVNPAVTFTLIGPDLPDAVAPEDRKYCIFKDEITEDAVLNTYYAASHILLITSHREGLPMVLMEAMAHGVVPIATNVGAMGLHVRSGVNGFLISGPDEDSLVAAFVTMISRALESHDSFNDLSYNAYRHALENFGGFGFCEKYRALLATPKQMTGEL